MSAMILSGKEMEKELLASQIERCGQLNARGIHPLLAVVMVGDDPASEIYVRNKSRMCDAVGILQQTIRMPADVSQESVEREIDRLNNDPAVTGILVQLPLPGQLDENQLLARILPQKDVDGFHALNAGKMLRGEACALACTPRGIIYMLKKAGVPMEGAHAVVIGRSNIVGKPVAMLLLQENCTVTICHSKTQNLAEITRQGDILIAAVGKAHFVTADMVKPGAAVIDVGVNRVDGKVTGDVDFENVKEVAGYISPVPGGVGRMTVSMLMENTLEAACRE
ncbi:MAG: bifunctional methylenetetrahydrofolate dehydrogenase/methenyltetrahydrofolate cyclohydrolase FolD [Clostridia bacterium]|nr:bifunctional methylenetetrahydrofolate dehydrogenase/methenyltetrahydrofolate cyclohydrolase FolD [Clostridia bacterium]